MAMPTSNVVFQQSPMTMTTLLQNQSMRFENDFMLADQSISESEINRNDYLNLYNGDLSPFETSVNGGYEAEFYCPNGTMPFCAPSTYNNLSPPAPAPAPAFYCPNYSYGTMLFCAPPTHNNLSPPAPTPMEGTGLISDVVNFCSNNRMHLVAANNGRARQSSKIRIIWTVDEHKLFLVGMVIFGSGNWKSIAYTVVLTKTHTQVASHAQKFFTRQQLPREKRKRKSIHDIDTVDPELLLEVCARLESQPRTRTQTRPPPSWTNYSPSCMHPVPTQPYEHFNNYVPNVEQLPPQPPQPPQP